MLAQTTLPMGHADDLVFLSRYDGLEYFRLNALGAYCLGLTGEYEPTVPPIQTSMSIYSDMRIQLKGELSHDVKMRLETYAKVESDDVLATFDGESYDRDREWSFTGGSA